MRLRGTRLCHASSQFALGSNITGTARGNCTQKPIMSTMVAQAREAG